MVRRLPHRGPEPEAERHVKYVPWRIGRNDEPTEQEDDQNTHWDVMVSFDGEVWYFAHKDLLQANLTDEFIKMHQRYPHVRRVSADKEAALRRVRRESEPDMQAMFRKHGIGRRP